MMKKFKTIIAAFFAVCSLTLVSLSLNAQTIIKSNSHNSFTSGLGLFKDGTNSLYYIEYDSDTTWIFSLPNDSLVFQCKGRIEPLRIFSPKNTSIAYFSPNSEQVTYKLDLESGVYEVIANYRCKFYSAYDGTKYVVSRDISAQEQVLSLFNSDNKSFYQDIIRSTQLDNTLLNSVGVVGDNLYFTTYGNNFESVIYRYDIIQDKLFIEDYAYGFQTGVGSYGVFAYAERLSEDNNLINVITEYGTEFYTQNKLYDNPGSLMTLDANGKFVVLFDDRVIEYDNVNRSIKEWSENFPIQSAKLSNGYVWTEYNGNMHNIIVSKDSSNNVVGSFSGSLVSSPDYRHFVVNDILYVVRASDDTIDLLSFSLSCPENLIITQSMIDSGQSYFKAKTVSVSGLINVSSGQNILIEAINSVNINSTSGFNVVNNPTERPGSVEIRMIHDCSN